MVYVEIRTRENASAALAPRPHDNKNKCICWCKMRVHVQINGFVIALSSVYVGAAVHGACCDVRSFILITAACSRARMVNLSGVCVCMCACAGVYAHVQVSDACENV